MLWPVSLSAVEEPALDFMEKALLTSDGEMPLLSAGMSDMVMDEDLLQKYLNDPNMLEGLSGVDSGLPELILTP